MQDSVRAHLHMRQLSDECVSLMSCSRADICLWTCVAQVTEVSMAGLGDWHLVYIWFTDCQNRMCSRR